MLLNGKMLLSGNMLLNGLPISKHNFRNIEQLEGQIIKVRWNSRKKVWSILHKENNHGHFFDDKIPKKYMVVGYINSLRLKGASFNRKGEATGVLQKANVKQIPEYFKRLPKNIVSCGDVIFTENGDFYGPILGMDWTEQHI